MLYYTIFIQYMIYNSHSFKSTFIISDRKLLPKYRNDSVNNEIFTSKFEYTS